ncbi:G-type lectin S-receptor-like serine/threonine-protein kinase At4g27290 [Arachis hypogaea]|uniref:G-type lectin S-receptor-like serine/threonine-protein kinase At4g27290 n=3 Tax=Arachis TaxID=3817 RepID=UPI000DEE06DF|nr:G-type lectin S-receptor-like serine/threonine-protein kinase At4g27290 [Arachis hypogaea]
MQRMKNFHHFVPIIFHLFLYFLLSKTIAATDTLTQFQSLSENQTLVSKNGDFELGFFTLDNSTNINYYLGIWYKNIPVRTIVWVANRENPATNHNFVVLLINNTANSTILLTQKNKNTVLWSVSISRKPKNPILQLLDSGNLVLRDENDENEEKNYLWQSFDYPGDTLLPGMKVGKDLRTGFDWRVTAWKNENDPSPGTLNWVMDVTNWPEPMQRIGTMKQYNSGPWNGVQYSAKPTNKPSPAFEFIYFADENQVYYMFKLVNNSVKARMMLNQTTNKIMQLVWTQGVWKMYGSMPRDFCDEYGACGPNGKCDMAESPNDCECLRGYRPKSPKEWIGLNYEGGCLRDKPLNCESDGFIKYVKMKVPDTENCWYLNQSMNSVECRDKCLRNCSCMAYANSDIRGEGNGCALWFGDLNDLRVQPNAGQDLYVRVPASELETRNGSKVKIEIAVGSTIFVVLCSLLLVLYFTCIRRRSSKAKENAAIMDSFIEEQEGHLELPLFDLSSLAKATGNFSINNKVGEGGFGPVYKGLLKNGQEIAVKRLCRGSVQGLKEFKNEIALIVKLQHRNLVKLHGCCIHNEEKMLVYEYLPNKSLDLFIFDQTRRKLLDWSKCFHMIFGIAKGLLYLHRDSRLRIIHRDLKASNVLLDSEMNPKISDFGMARILGGDQIAATTRRVVGTYGYMAPEYAIDGNFSVKSDVFSFGILLLEILSGKKNKGNHWENESTDLIGYAWDLWTEERPLEIVDDILKESCNLSEILRCIQISLLCLEQHPYDRPDMSSVIMMFGSEIPLPKPKQPALVVGEYAYQYDSANELSIEVLESR